jgi:hypothetical protein
MLLTLRTSAFATEPAKADSEAAANKLRTFLPKQPNSKRKFDKFVRLARGLDDGGLTALVREVGLCDSSGYRPWIRSAIYAEWARRDLDAAFNYLVGNLRPGWKTSPVNGALYAVFVGSRPKDPEAALGHLRELLDGERFKKGPRRHAGSDWARHAYRRVFAELAAKNPEQAWRQLPGRSQDGETNLDHWKVMYANPGYEDMVEGFFSDLKEQETFLAFAGRWGNAPTPETIAIRIAKSWFRFDPPAALKWALRFDNPPGVAARLIYGVSGNALLAWAYENPKAALKALRDDSILAWAGIDRKVALSVNPNFVVIQSTATKQAAREAYHAELFREWYHSLPTTIIKAQPALAAQIVEHLRHNPIEGAKTPRYFYPLHNCVRDVFQLEKNARFPEPGRANRPPDYTGRYKTLVGTIRAASFSEKDEALLLRNLKIQYEQLLNQ